MDPRGLRFIINTYFSLLSHTKELLLVTFCDTTAGIEVSSRTHRQADRHGGRHTYFNVLGMYIYLDVLSI